MKTPERQRMKLAELILASAHDVKQKHLGEVHAELRHLQEANHELKSLQRQLQICQAKCWMVAANYVRDRIASTAGDVAAYANKIIMQCKDDAVRRDAPATCIRDIVADLQQLEQEFGPYKYDAQAKTLSVTTEPITLQDIALGSFEIEMDFKAVTDAVRHVSYRIVALQPNPAGANDSVTHPHVRDEGLCEGDATLPIRVALESGRVCDFFMLVRSVLQHYNSGSPYVALDDWNGTNCHDCGYVSGETSYCQCCSEDFCEECISYCRGCDTTMCRNCLEKCAACGDRMCSDCRKLCKECREITCLDCLEKELCPTCRKKAEEDHERCERELLERQQEIDSQQRDSEEWNIAQQLDQQRRHEATAAVAAAEEIIVANAAA